MRMRTAAALAAALGLAAVACGGEDKADAVQCGNAGTAASYNGNVKAFLENNCTECHSSSARLPWQRKGAPSGVDYDTLSDAKSHASSGASEVAGGSMPPEGGASKLSASDRCLLQAWVNAGTPE
jgi:uncharacterized membrane protein